MREGSTQEGEATEEGGGRGGEEDGEGIGDLKKERDRGLVGGTLVVAEIN